MILQYFMLSSPDVVICFHTVSHPFLHKIQNALSLLHLLVEKRKLLASKYFKLAHAGLKPGTSNLYSFKTLAFKLSWYSTCLHGLFYTKCPLKSIELHSFLFLIPWISLIFLLKDHLMFYRIIWFVIVFLCFIISYFGLICSCSVFYQTISYEYDLVCKWKSGEQGTGGEKGRGWPGGRLITW